MNKEGEIKCCNHVIKEMDYDYDLEIQLPIVLRHEDAVISFTLGSDVISDETLSMIFEDIDKELEREGYGE